MGQEGDGWLRDGNRDEEREGQSPVLHPQHSESHRLVHIHTMYTHPLTSCARRSMAASRVSILEEGPRNWLAIACTDPTLSLSRREVNGRDRYDTAKTQTRTADGDILSLIPYNNIYQPTHSAMPHINDIHVDHLPPRALNLHRRGARARDPTPATPLLPLPTGGQQGGRRSHRRRRRRSSSKGSRAAAHAA